MNAQIDTTGMKVMLNALAEAAEEYQDASSAMMRGNPRNPYAPTREEQARFQHASEQLKTAIVNSRSV